jgi:hypothetical protein
MPLHLSGRHLFGPGGMDYSLNAHAEAIPG